MCVCAPPNLRNAKQANVIPQQGVLAPPPRRDARLLKPSFQSIRDPGWRRDKQISTGHLEITHIGNRVSVIGSGRREIQLMGIP
jgi:hypothetical protein